MLLLSNGFVVLFGWPKRNGVDIDAVVGAVGAVVANVGALKRFRSVETSVLGRFNEIDLVLSSVEVGVPNENNGFGWATEAGDWIKTFSKTFMPAVSGAEIDVDGFAVSVTSDENVAAVEPNFDDPNVGADEPKLNGFETVVVAVDVTVELTTLVLCSANGDPKDGCVDDNENVFDVDVTAFDEVTAVAVGAPNWKEVDNVADGFDPKLNVDVEGEPKVFWVFTVESIFSSAVFGFSVLQQMHLLSV